MSVPASKPSSKCPACGTSFTPCLDLESDTFQEKLLSDYDPAAREGIEATVSLVEEEFQDCATEIKRLQLRQQQLMLCGLKLQSLLSPSPIKTLPNEVLMYVFDYVSQDNLFLEERDMSPCDLWPGDENGLTTMPALVLSSVCSRWRRISLSYSALWSRMSVIVNMNARDSQFGRLTTTLKLYLDRSSTSLLRLRIETQTQYWDYDVTHFALSLLGQYSHRWQHLTLIGTCDFSREAFSLPADVHDFPMLEGLEFDCTTAESLDIFKHAPKLWSLVVQRNPFDTYSPMAVFSWRQLTSLDVAYDDYAVNSCPNLISLRISSGLGDDVITLDAPDVLHSLESLSVVISDAKLDTGLVDGVMSSLTCPALTSLMVERRLVWQDSTSSITWPLEKLESFLARSSCALISLSIKGLQLSSSEFITVLKRQPSLASLVIEDHRDGSKSVAPSLIQSLRLSTFRPSSDHPLLPKLRHLSLAYTGEAFDDAILVDMVESRCLPIVDAEKQGINPLRSLVLKSLDRTFDEGVAEIYEPLRKLDDAGFRLVIIFQDQREL